VQGGVDDAIELIRAQVDAGDKFAAARLVDLLAKEGRSDELPARADAGDRSAAEQLARLLAEQGRVDDAIELFRTKADAGDWFAADRLARLLAKEGRIDELRTEVDAGTPNASD
jgi:hypothetical protein